MSFSQSFFTVYFRAEENNEVNLPNRTQRKHSFLVKIMDMLKKKKLLARKKIALELLHQRLGHISNRSLLDGDTANVWEYVELRIDPDPF